MNEDDLAEYISNQEALIKLDYDLITKEKQKTKMENIDLFFNLKSTNWSKKETRIWTTTLPLPKNLIPPEYLIMTDPTYVNVSDKIQINFLEDSDDSDDSEDSEDTKDTKDSKDSIEGTVIKISNGELTAIFELDWKEDNARHKCTIQFFPNDIVFKRKLKALDFLKDLNEDHKKMLCGIYPEKPIQKEITFHLPKNYPFNESQKKAIQMAVTNPFSLIQGPPGTGKTHTIGGIAVQSLHQDRTKKVLICGTTNVSINSLLEIVGDMVQLSGFKVCWPAASQKDFTSEKDLTKEQKLMTLYKSIQHNSEMGKRFKYLFNKEKREPKEEKEMKDLREKLENIIIKESDVIFSTLDSSSKYSILKNIRPVSTLIVDEATLSVESSMIIPLSLCPDRFVLVGDHKQLGPQPSFEELNKKGYYQSLFERIIQKKLCLKNSVMLSTQYRMHPDISRMPNQLFYNNELIDGVQPRDRKIAEKFVLKKHLNFINNSSKDERNGTSYINKAEIIIVSKLVNSLIQCGVNSSQIGVISAYGAQTQLISENLKNNNLRVKVSTIDSFQGSQRDYIIICTTRSGSTLGFLSDNRRMNVAITRARCFAAIIGNSDTLSHSTSWCEIINYTKNKGSYYEKLPNQIEKTKQKQLIITKSKDNCVRVMVTEFKEKTKDAGYKLDEIESQISDSTVRVLWPDEDRDVSFLKDWVKDRLLTLNKNKFVTLVYDAEDVCMKIGEIFDKNVDYYNWEAGEEEPEIKTSESFIISFYRHKGKFEHDAKLVNILKPLFEHPKITLITFDFIYDFDKLYDYGIQLHTNQIIDIQLEKIPEDPFHYQNVDMICLKGWNGIKGFIVQASNDNVNGCIIDRAKDIFKNGKKDFPHQENNFLVDNFNYPPICKFTKAFLVNSADDIFYIAIAGVDLLCREFDEVKERTKEKFKLFKKYRNKYGNTFEFQSAYYVSESCTSAIQGQFSKDSQTYQLFSYYKILKTFVSTIDKHDGLIESIIPHFAKEDKDHIQKRFKEVVKIMKDTENGHLGNIKDNAILASVDGIAIPSKPAFVLRSKEEGDDDEEEEDFEERSKKANTKKPNSSTIKDKKSKTLLKPKKREISDSTSSSSLSEESQPKILKPKNTSVSKKSTKLENTKPPKKENIKPIKSDDTKPPKKKDIKPIKSDDTEPAKKEAIKPIKSDDAKPAKKEAIKPNKSDEAKPNKQESSTKNKQESTKLSSKIDQKKNISSIKQEDDKTDDDISESSQSQKDQQDKKKDGTDDNESLSYFNRPEGKKIYSRLMRIIKKKSSSNIQQKNKANDIDDDDDDDKTPQTPKIQSTKKEETITTNKEKESTKKVKASIIKKSSFTPKLKNISEDDDDDDKIPQPSKKQQIKKRETTTKEKESPKIVKTSINKKPLIKSKHKNISDEEEEEDDDDDDEIPQPSKKQPIKKRETTTKEKENPKIVKTSINKKSSITPKRKNISDDEDDEDKEDKDDDEDDDDDDVPQPSKKQQVKKRETTTKEKENPKKVKTSINKKSLIKSKHKNISDEEEEEDDDDDDEIPQPSKKQPIKKRKTTISQKKGPERTRRTSDSDFDSDSFF